MSEFRFKQFRIKQEKSAAKIGTDGVLTGAWCPIPPGKIHVLDVGSGTGLIALMIAQRSDNAFITAIDMDLEAWQECGENFKNSPWSNRLTAVHGEFESFDFKNKFDLIVSNPPFFSAESFAPDPRRKNARNTDSLSFESLISKASALMVDEGVFCLIIPYHSEETILKLGEENGLFPWRILRIKGHGEAPLKRSLIAFSKNHKIPEISTLVIENSRHNYTDEYRALTKDFYFKM